jgi:hypothetical protein
MSPVAALKRLQDEMMPYYPLGIYKDEDIHNSAKEATE